MIVLHYDFVYLGKKLTVMKLKRIITFMNMKKHKKYKKPEYLYIIFN